MDFLPRYNDSHCEPPHAAHHSAATPWLDGVGFGYAARAKCALADVAGHVEDSHVARRLCSCQKVPLGIPHRRTDIGIRFDAAQQRATVCSDGINVNSFGVASGGEP
eukprot:353440-Chlamydomonas_euryale.AAC.3